MTKPKLIVLSVSIAILASTSGKVEANVNGHEPSFEIASSTHKHNSNLELALTNNGFDQIGHGLIMLALISLLAFRKDKKS